jgi:hypothetical protein
MLSHGFLGGRSQGLPWGILEFTCTAQPGLGLPARAAVSAASDTAPGQYVVAPTNRAGPITIGATAAEAKACPCACRPSCGAADDCCGGWKEEDKYVPQDRVSLSPSNLQPQKGLLLRRLKSLPPKQIFHIGLELGFSDTCS